MDNLVNLPDASRLIMGLRDTGYNFNTAVADIIDNSIAAEATEVNVDVELLTDGQKHVYFGDNGIGMDAQGLHSAMRYGAPQRTDQASLGKFGLGLKTASSSVCIRFSVISRQDEGQALNKLTWDLDHVEEINQWEMLSEPVTEDETLKFSELCGPKGTLVVWSKCDRLLAKEYSEPGGSNEKRAIRGRVDRLRTHLELIYYRFLLAADDREKLVQISLDGQLLEGWDPFYREKSEQVLPEPQQVIKIETEDGSVHEAKIRAWILPHRKDMTKEENKEKAKITNIGQGFYIHREGRIINNGGWLGVFGAVEPHTSLLRVEFDFGYELDDAFRVDVKKSRILFDPALEDHLKELLQPVYKEADNRFRRRAKKIAAGMGIDHGSSNKSIENAKMTTKKPWVTEVDENKQTAKFKNNQGSGITLKVPVQSHVTPENVHVEPVEDITSGRLWEPALRSPGDAGYVVGVRINKHHDFYQKIYLRAEALGYAVEGLDLLLWAFAAAELNNTNSELEPVFEDLRLEVANNLEKLLRDTPQPDESELEELLAVQGS